VGTLAMEFFEEWLCGKIYVRMDEAVKEKASKKRGAA